MDKPSLEDLQKLREALSSPQLHQQHLFVGWPDLAEQYNKEQVALLTELYNFQYEYNGGIAQYIATAQELLNSDEEVESIVALDVPPILTEVPDLFVRSPELTALQSRAPALLKKTIFVLVAGGVGERLGYSGVKVGLPMETATNTCYLAHYLRWAKQVGGHNVPFVIMTSEDTHRGVLELIEKLQLGLNNLLVLKQNTVFCFTDSSAALATKDGKLLRKPHGHGDVHTLIHNAKDKSGRPIIDRWYEQEYQYIAFMQDTNGPATLTLPISVALSERERMDMNFTCIPRLPREAIGLLCNVQQSNGHPWHVANVEYNVVEMLPSSVMTAGGGGSSPRHRLAVLPGSVNTLVFAFETYRELLQLSNGKVPEFINPKYEDDDRLVFKKPARIESLMQDFAELYTPKHRVGGCVFSRFTYQPVKNAMSEALVKVQHGMSPFCAATGEAGCYELFRRLLCAVGVQPQHGDKLRINKFIEVQLFPVVVLDAVTMGSGSLEELSAVFPNPTHVKISSRSTLLISGRVVIEGLTLDGAVRIVGPTDPAAPPLVIRDAEVHNSGWTARVTSEEDTNEVDQMRGFVLEKRVTETLRGEGTMSSSQSSDSAKL